MRGGGYKDIPDEDSNPDKGAGTAKDDMNVGGRYGISRLKVRKNAIVQSHCSRFQQRVFSLRIKENKLTLSVYVHLDMKDSFPNLTVLPG